MIDGSSGDMEASLTLFIPLYKLLRGPWAGGGGVLESFGGQARAGIEQSSGLIFQSKFGLLPLYTSYMAKRSNIPGLCGSLEGSTIPRSLTNNYIVPPSPLSHSFSKCLPLNQHGAAIIQNTRVLYKSSIAKYLVRIDMKCWIFWPCTK
jgi:hypothetical protein